MSISSLVDKIYVMAIPERINYISNILKKDYKIDFEIVSAILGKDINKQDLIDKNIISKNIKLNNNQIACYLTFLKTLDIFLNTDSEKCIIFEDDLQLPLVGINYYEKIKQLLEETPKNFDMIYMGRCYDDCSRDQKITENVSRCFFPKCNHALIVSKKGAKKLKNILKYLSYEKDVTIANSIFNKNLIAYAANPPLFYQNRNNIKSTLGYKYQKLPICENYTTKIIIIGGITIILILIIIIILIKITKKN